MLKTVENEEYLDTQEAVQALNISRKLFYDNIRPSLQPYRFDGKKKPWYRARDIRALQAGRPVRRASIPINGMFGSWAAFAEAQYGAETDNLRVEICSLPSDVAERFALPAGTQFVRRSRLTRVGQSVICSWDTYYPLDLVEDVLGDLKNGTAQHIVEHIKDRHGVTIAHVKDVYSSRMTTPDEVNLFRLSMDEPMLILQRASYTQDKRVVLFSDMALLANWFIHEHEYDVTQKSA